MPLIDDEMLKENNFLFLPQAIENGGDIFPKSAGDNPCPDAYKFRLW